MMGWGWGWGFHWLGLIWMVLFWGAVIGAVVWLVNTLARPRAAGARQILDERYARGEITREQYLAMKDDLSGRRS